MSICIYCKRDKDDSISHIIPEGLGKGETLTVGVCADCNHEINKRAEEPIIKSLSFIRNVLQLDGKRNKRPPIPMKSDFGGVAYELNVRSVSELEQKIRVFKNPTGPGGQKKKIAFLGPTNEVLKRQKEYEKKHPNTKWEGIEPQEMENLTDYVEFDFSIFGTQEALRVAAKIAFEKFCLLKGTEAVLSKDFDPIRSFIWEGKVSPNGPVASICCDRNVWNAIGNIPLGIHTILISEDSQSSCLVAIVGIFSVVYHKILLSSRYRSLALSRIDGLFTINPQTGIVYEPRIHTPSARPPRIAVQSREDRLDPQDVLQKMHSELRERWNEGFRKLGIVREKK